MAVQAVSVFSPSVVDSSVAFAKEGDDSDLLIGKEE